MGVAAPSLAAQPKLPPGAPECARPGTRPIFLGPMGEPFRAAPGQPYPSAAWFAGADRNGDGVVTREELVSDALRFFAKLDLDHDSRLTPDEVDAYERDIAPETALYTRGGDDFGRTERSRGGRSGRQDYGGPMGAGRYAWINIPEPVVAADEDVNRVVTRDEFAAAAGRTYDRLDITARGGLRLADLPKTPQQQAIEGPCRPPRHKRRDNEREGDDRLPG